MNDNPFAQLVPGFDFLQNLVKNAGAALPGMGQWVAPTLNPDELEKRIQELRTVQFWLEQNARMLAATIQAMEVQRMTLSTLQSMNVSMHDLKDSLKASASPEAPAAASPAAAPAEAAEAAKPASIDPMQWWTALSQQFTELAHHALKDTPADALVKQGMAVATETLQKAAAVPTAVAEAVAKASPKAAPKAGVKRAAPSSATAPPAAKTASPRSPRKS